MDVNKVYITKEVANLLDINSSYLIRLAKKLLESGELTDSDIRIAGKSNYLYNERAISVIRNNLKRK
ncbi:MAG: hypothetical protein N4A45_06350 [Flavobacteriales bacterium]|nr:hypothetical protein [Flavobacteriales bacterium]